MNKNFLRVKRIGTLLLSAILALSVSACSGTSVKKNSSSSAVQTTGNQEAASDSGRKAVQNAPLPAGHHLDSFPDPKKAAAKDMKVYYIHSTVSYESQARSLWTAKVEAAHRGWTLVPLEYESASEYMTMFNTALNDPKTTAIICGVVAGFDGYTHVIAQARNKGIGIYCLDNVINDGVICNATMPNGVASMEMAYTIGEKYKWSLNYCIFTAKAARVHMERSEPIRAFFPLFTNMKLVAYDDGSSNAANQTLTSFDVVKAWLQKYQNIDWIFSTNDQNAENAAEAIKAVGKENEIFTSGMGGGSNCWSYIRDSKSAFRYSYAQPYEEMTHYTFEAISDTQVKGVYPGQQGATLSDVGQTLYYRGVIVNKDNVPAIGANLNSVFDYYNASDKSAWYNWTDGPGIEYVTNGSTTTTKK